jgi:hypothetical protein
MWLVFLRAAVWMLAWLPGWVCVLSSARRVQRPPFARTTCTPWSEVWLDGDSPAFCDAEADVIDIEAPCLVNGGHGASLGQLMCLWHGAGSSSRKAKKMLAEARRQQVRGRQDISR